MKNYILIINWIYPNRILIRRKNMRYLKMTLVSLEAVHTHTHTDSLVNNKKVNNLGRVILSCISIDTG